MANSATVPVSAPNVPAHKLKKSAKVHPYQQMNLKCMLSRKILYFATQDRANKSNKHQI